MVSHDAKKYIVIKKNDYKVDGTFEKKTIKSKALLL